MAYYLPNGRLVFVEAENGSNVEQVRRILVSAYFMLLQIASCFFFGLQMGKSFWKPSVDLIPLILLGCAILNALLWYKYLWKGGKPEAYILLGFTMAAVVCGMFLGSDYGRYYGTIGVMSW